MKTQTLPLESLAKGSAAKALLIGIESLNLKARIVRWSLAGTVAMATAIAAIWSATTPQAGHLFNAVLWVAGFAFFALALEVGLRKIFPYIFTGMILPVLAVLGSEVAPEFSMLAGAIVAAWLAYWIGRGQ